MACGTEPMRIAERDRGMIIMRRAGKIRRKVLTAVLCAALCAALPAGPASAAFAAGPGETGAEAEAATSVLDDHVLEYGELAEAIRDGNPTMLASLKSYSDRIAQYQKARDDLKFQRIAVYDELKTAKDQDLAEKSSLQMEYETLSMAGERYKSMVESMQEISSTAQLRRTERSMVIAAQALMISYESLKHQENTMAKAVELYETGAELTRLRRQAGLASDTDVLTAENRLLTARTALANVQENLAEVYENLCYMVGQPGDGSLVIAAIPAPDESRIAGMDLAADTWKAIGNNAQLISDRHTKNGSTAHTQVRQMTIGQGEDQLTAKMKELYDAVLQKQSALRTAEVTLQKGQREKQNADLKYSAGLLDREAYLRQEQSWLDCSASYDAAQLALTNALDTYDWAVAGSVSLR